MWLIGLLADLLAGLSGLSTGFCMVRWLALWLAPRLGQWLADCLAAWLGWLENRGEENINNRKAILMCSKQRICES